MQMTNSDWLCQQASQAEACQGLTPKRKDLPSARPEAHDSCDGSQSLFTPHSCVCKFRMFSMRQMCHLDGGVQHMDAAPITGGQGLPHLNSAEMER